MNRGFRSNSPEPNHPELDPEDLPTERFAPTGSQIGLSILLIAAGLAATLAIAKLGEGAED